jgi:uncharacterized protein YukE
VTEPTLAEVARRLDGITGQLSNLLARLDSERDRAQQTFVNRETYQSDQRLYDAIHAALRTDITTLENAAEDDKKWRRAASFNLAVMAVGWLLTIALALLTLTR